MIQELTQDCRFSPIVETKRKAGSKMRVRTAAGLVAVAGALVFASPALAWDAKECADWYAKTGQIHPDCTWWKPPVVEKPPPVVPPVAPPVVPPVAPPVVTPPETPPVAPPVVPPTEGTPPPVDTPKPVKPKYDHPDAPRRQTGTAGKTEQRGSSYTPQGQTRTVSASSENGTLPYTGLPAGIMALAGAGLAAAGYRLRRR